jgi:hypothetical protein
MDLFGSKKRAVIAHQKEELLRHRIAWRAVRLGIYSRQEFHNETEGLSGFVDSFDRLFRDQAYEAYMRFTEGNDA